MSKKSKVGIAYTNIGLMILYPFVVLGYFMTNTDTFLVFWEVISVLGAFTISALLISIFGDIEDDRKILKVVAISTMSCAVTLTSVAHFISITFIIPMENSGVIFPDYFHFARPPSVIMSIEYLSWGLFMGLSFLFTSFALSPKKVHLKKVKHTLTICGCLLIIGLSGPLTNMTHLWFLAVAGYAIGTIVVSIQMISLLKGTLLESK